MVFDSWRCSRKASSLPHAMSNVCYFVNHQKECHNNPLTWITFKIKWDSVRAVWQTTRFSYIYIFCVKWLHRDKSKPIWNPLKQGHCDWVHCFYEGGKCRQTITATESRVCGMIEVTETSGLSALIRVSHIVQASSLLTWHYMVVVICTDERGKEKVQSTTRPKKGSVRTHIKTQTNKTQKTRDTICQSKLDVLASLSQHWLKWRLSNSAQNASLTSKELFHIDWLDAVTLDC